MPGPLEITFPQLSDDPYEVDENITMLVHWNPGNFRYMSHDMRFPTMWYVRPAKAQTSLRIRAD